MDHEQHALVEELLQPVGVARLCGCGQVPAQRGATGRAEKVERVQEALDVGAERLRFDSTPRHRPGGRARCSAPARGEPGS